MRDQAPNAYVAVRFEAAGAVEEVLECEDAFRAAIAAIPGGDLYGIRLAYNLP